MSRQETTITFPAPIPLRPVIAAIGQLRAAGHVVQIEDIPGLWRIDGGPELTTAQLLGEAARLA